MKTVLLVAIRPIGSPSVNSQHNIPTFKIKDSGFRHVKLNCCDGFNFKENYWNICITLTVSVQLVSGDDNLRMRRALLRGRVSMRMRMVMAKMIKSKMTLMITEGWRGGGRSGVARSTMTSPPLQLFSQQPKQEGGMQLCVSTPKREVDGKVGGNPAQPQSVKRIFQKINF